MGTQDQRFTKWELWSHSLFLFCRYAVEWWPLKSFCRPFWCDSQGDLWHFAESVTGNINPSNELHRSLEGFELGSNISIVCSHKPSLYSIQEVNNVLYLQSVILGASWPMTFDPPLHALWSDPSVCPQAGNRVWCWPTSGVVPGPPTVGSPAHKQQQQIWLHQTHPTATIRSEAGIKRTRLVVVRRSSVTLGWYGEVSTQLLVFMFASFYSFWLSTQSKRCYLVTFYCGWHRRFYTFSSKAIQICANIE